MNKHVGGEDRDLLAEAIQYLISSGFTVERATDIPGLYYVNNGSELTEMQLISFARQNGFPV